MPGCLTSPKIYNLTYLTMRVSSLLEPTLRGTYSSPAVQWSNRGVEADHRSILPQCLRALPELHYGDASVNPRGPKQGLWLTSLDLKDVYFHIGINPADTRYLRFCHNGTAWQFTVLPFGLSTSPRVFTKILKPVLAYAHLHRVILHMYLDDWLLNPGTHQEPLELKSLCRRLGLVLDLEKSDLIHLRLPLIWGSSWTLLSAWQGHHTRE